MGIKPGLAVTRCHNDDLNVHAYALQTGGYSGDLRAVCKFN